MFPLIGGSAESWQLRQSNLCIYLFVIVPLVKICEGWFAIGEFAIGEFAIGESASSDLAINDV